ncbi:MAG: recombination mediator RecR [bacterium]
MGRGGDRASVGIPAVDRAVTELCKLPGIGPRMAQRLVYNLLRRDASEIRSLSKALQDLSSNIRRCSVCGYYSETDPCHICTSESRDKKVICVVEQPQDVYAIERTSGFSGVYHILGGALSPIDGIGPEEIRVRGLLERLRSDVREVIVATNPTLEGDATAMYLQNVIKPLGIRVSRIARGLPTGGDLEYADETTLSTALSMRTDM